MSIIEKAVEQLEQNYDRTRAEPKTADDAVGLTHDRADTAELVENRDIRPNVEGPGHMFAPSAHGSDRGNVSVGELDERRVRRSASEVHLDLKKLAEKHVITPEGGDTTLIEEHRLIKRPLLLNATANTANAVDNSNLIMVTSSVPGEGKTFTAINLAMSIAMERDRTVLLVDADVAKSDVSRVLGFDANEGLTDLLSREELELADVLVKTNIATLSILPAGPKRPNMTELFASMHMKQVAAQLGQRYRDRIVIFDSPPLLAASGASVLASLVGQIVYVVEAERTSQSALHEGLKLLGRSDNVGIVFNKSRQRPRSRYYGYGYYYGSYGR